MFDRTWLRPKLLYLYLTYLDQWVCTLSYLQMAYQGNWKLSITRMTYFYIIHPVYMNGLPSVSEDQCSYHLTITWLRAWHSDHWHPRQLSGKELPANTSDASLIPGSGKSTGGGNGNAIQYSCLESPMDRGAWRATVHGVAKSWIQLSAHA